MLLFALFVKRYRIIYTYTKYMSYNIYNLFNITKISYILLPDFLQVLQIKKSDDLIRLLNLLIIFAFSTQDFFTLSH